MLVRLLCCSLLFQNKHLRLLTFTFLFIFKVDGNSKQGREDRLCRPTWLVNQGTNNAHFYLMQVFVIPKVLRNHRRQPISTV